MTIDTARHLIDAVFPEAEQDDIDTYIEGPDDPEDYFSKIEGQDELTADFKEFLAGAPAAPPAATNVYDYFAEKLGETPDDGTLTQLPVASACGQDCVRVIDAAAALAHVVDCSVVASVAAVAEEAVAVFWRG